MNRVKELREKQGIKQTELAKTLSISQGTLSNWERGVHDPDNDALAKLAVYFDVTTDYLLGLNENVKPLIIPDELDGVNVAFHRGDFEDLTQDEIDALATIARTLKAQRKL